MLVDHFIQKHNSLLKRDVKSVSKSAMDLLIQYDWSRNIRDLENAIQSAIILAHDNIITEEALPIRVSGYPDIEKNFEMDKNGLDEKVKQLNSKVEKEIIINALEKCNQNRTATANMLKISRKTLFNKMKSFSLLH